MSADGARIYLGRLSHRVREKDVERFFKGYGRITDIILKNGFGFVDFEDGRDAEDAAYDLNGKDLMGDRVLVEIARGTPHGRDRILDDQKRKQRRGDRYRSRSRSPRRRSPIRSPRRDSFRVTIENLSSRASRSDLKDLFRKFDVLHAEVDTHKREGVVEFGSKSDMKKAIEKYDGYEFNGRKLKLIPESGGRSVSRSRSKSGSKSVSRSRSRSPAAAAEQNGEKANGEDGGSPARSVSKSPSRERSRSASRSADENGGDHSF